MEFIDTETYEDQPDYAMELSKAAWHNWEAASIISDFDPKHVARIDSFQGRYVIIISEAQQLLDIMKTWRFPKASPFWFINQCIKTGAAQKFSPKLLQELRKLVMYYTSDDKKTFDEHYPYLSKKLTSVASDMLNETRSSEVDGFKQIIDQTYDHFWRDHNPKRPPKSEEIIKWVEGKYDLPSYIAKAIDAMIRPEQFKGGGNRSKS